MAHSNPPAKTDYEDLHAATVDAIDWYVKTEFLEQAAHEVLDRLRDNGLAIPSKTSA